MKERVTRGLDEISKLFGSINWSTFSLPKIRLNDALDVLVIAFLIYKILLWVKVTRAWSLIKGLVIILVVYFLSSALEMRTVSWLIVNSLNVGLVAVLVIFQPELRKLLIEIGEGKINKFFSVPGHKNATLRNSAVIEILRAAEYMANKRIGALIVIENEISLADIDGTGIRIDAICTGQLLINIFIDKTPLHDGAVVVRNDRITAASCILPLTEREIGRELGTRHRAAVGISEITDADVVVVSEETGGISIANNGELYRGLSNDEIKKMLLKDEPPRTKKKLSLKGGRKNADIT